MKKQSNMFWLGVLISIFCFGVMILNFVTGWWLGGALMLMCLAVNLHYAKKNYRRG